ncbi:uncharacterized protein LOC132195897 [Neocloeon triangulifer]|uniref:uncharacterized protein LOC132195897 n=1 Tax=Neocloeon triangulifer TaxID=2078957 RepID=UPI00286EFEBC|nr:uncharacterized protein LOC132195897 [Neocloeon triangulifer]
MSNLPFGCQLSVAHSNKIHFDFRSSELSLAKIIYDRLQLVEGKLVRQAPKAETAATGGEGVGADRSLQYDSLSQADATQIKADPKKASLGSLVIFCIANKLQYHGCVEKDDFAILVDRAQRKERGKLRRDQADADEQGRPKKRKSI